MTKKRQACGSVSNQRQQISTAKEIFQNPAWLSCLPVYFKKISEIRCPEITNISVHNIKISGEIHENTHSTCTRTSYLLYLYVL